METLLEPVKLNYGQFGLKAVQPERIIGKQIEAARVALTRYMKRTGKGLDKNFSKYSSFKETNRSKNG
jgi:large subunit ribosomal protein L16